ncbi:hypothetical protein CFOL_v3_13907, partial [Cephalotus follicularis]
PFEAAYGQKPQRVLDLVSLPQEARASDDCEAFADHICRRVKEFEEAGMVLLYLRKEKYPKRTYHKLKARKFGPGKVLKKICSN